MVFSGPQEMPSEEVLEASEEVLEAYRHKWASMLEMVFVFLSSTAPEQKIS